MLQIPDEWRDAIVVKIRERHNVLGVTAHVWLDDVLKKGDQSSYWNFVRPAALEFIKPIWDLTSPLLEHIWRSLDSGLNARAEQIIAGVDDLEVFVADTDPSDKD